MGSSGRWIVGVSGASGIRYALRLIDVLSNEGRETHVVFTDAALRVMSDEEGIKVSATGLSAKRLFGDERPSLVFHHHRDIGAPIASGSFLSEGMVIVPCSMATLGAIAHGVPQHLLHRAAEVVLKERRRLIVVPRETPLSTIHIENMLKLSQLGVQVIPAMPGFYHKPATVTDLVDMMVMKILDSMGIHTSLVNRWGEEVHEPSSICENS